MTAPLGRARVWRLLPLSAAEWRAHPWRQISAAAAVALGVALAYSVHLINDSALTEFASAVHAVHGEPDLSLVAPAPGFDDVLWERVVAHPDVAAAHPRVDIDTLAFAPDGGAFAVHVVGVDALLLGALAPQLMPQPDEGANALSTLDPTQAFVNPGLAQRLGSAAQVSVLAGGHTLNLTRAGRVAAGGPPLMVIDIAAAQAAFGRAGQLSRIDIRLRPGTRIDNLMNELSLPPSVQIETQKSGERRVSNLSLAYRVNLTVLALVALVVGGFLVYSVVSLAVAQRTSGFALLGVLGMSARDRRTLVLAECALTGAAASIAGVGLGTALAALALRLLSGDLGGGYFAGSAPPLQFSWPAALLFAALGTAAAVVGGWWPARQAARMSPAQALKGLGSTLNVAPRATPGLALLAAGALLALLPPIDELPLAAYASVAALLVGGIALVPYAVHLLLGQRGPRAARHALVLLAMERARYFRATATAAVAGVVASLALSVALTVMVASFRDAVSTWLDAVLPADLYVRAALPGTSSDQLAFPAEWVERAGTLPGVARALPGRSVTLQLQADQPEVWLLARTLPERPEQALPIVGELLPPLPSLPLRPVSPGHSMPPDATPSAQAPAAATQGPAAAIEAEVFVSEAMVSLYRAEPGTLLTLPLAGRSVTVRVRGVWRDYARQFGSIVMRLSDYRQVTRDEQLSELAVWLDAGAGSAVVEQRLRSLAQELGGDPRTLSFTTPAQLRALSLSIFDRSFAVTRYLQVVAIAIGLAGVAASLSAQVLARRREFGLLHHLGLTRRQVLALVSAETAAWLAAGTVVGLGLGLAISAVLVHVVNPQSFHWTMALRVPPLPVAALAAGVMLAGVLAAWLSARYAASPDAVRAVREDW